MVIIFIKCAKPFSVNNNDGSLMFFVLLTVKDFFPNP